jgi:hypothetical protein
MAMKSIHVLTAALAIFLSAWTGFLARLKGYSAVCWLLAGGIIGVIVLTGLPFITPFEERKRRRGNLLGLLLSGLTLVTCYLLRNLL